MRVFSPAHVAVLLEEAYTLKCRLDAKASDDVYDPQFHLQRRYNEVKDELAEIQQAEGLTRLTHGRIGFRLVHHAGRKNLDHEAFINELRFRGVKEDDIQAALDMATTTIKEYWTREVYHD